MPYRTFVDSLGAEWQVWDIVPRLSERRNLADTDRRVELVPISFADRRRASRRLAETRRGVLRGTYARGWLCFECNQEKRRLSPIPEDWTTCSDDLLEAYARHAERAGSSNRAFSFDGDEPMAEAG